MTARSYIEVYCDGSGEERVGRPGGWAFLVVRDGEVLHTGHGAAPETTSLVMELEAARAALAEVVEAKWHLEHEVVLISDSRIALEVASGTFMPRPLKYRPLSESLRAVAVAANARTKWVRAHAGHPWNERVDALAHEAKVAQAAPKKKPRRRR